ncbi:MAG: cytochrome c [Gemmatimonadaceae bacterium]|nr:cytochrome c [Gemmatimonadaceae bacterium]
MTRVSRLTKTIPLVLLASSMLGACGGGEAKPSTDSTDGGQAIAEAAVPTRGEATYSQICASCHQATGLGVEGNFPPLKNSAWLTGDPNVPIAIVLGGLAGEIVVDGKTYNGAMQAWGMLSDDDVANVLTYARSQWGNTAGPVTAEQVKLVREQMGSRGIWTADELKKTYPGAGG